MPATGASGIISALKSTSATECIVTITGMINRGTTAASA